MHIEKAILNYQHVFFETVCLLIVNFFLLFEVKIDLTKMLLNNLYTKYAICNMLVGDVELIYLVGNVSHQANPITSRFYISQ